MAFDLPADVRGALQRLAEGQSRAELARRAAAQSAGYRGGQGSAAIRDSLDALAYALVRMPATFAATAAALAQLQARLPDFAPASLLDIGAGPGTASLAAAERFPGLAGITQIDSNPGLRDFAATLARDLPRHAGTRRIAGDGRAALAAAEGADLVIAAYVMAELPVAGIAAFATALWQRTHQALLLVEPGTPEGYARILAARGALLAGGAAIVAPCPHAAPCPLQPPDWCHFVQRLARSRDHLQVKAAEVPYEDEKFSYLAVAREPAPAARDARVLAPPLVTKVGVTAKLCRPDGTAALAQVPRRDKAAFAAARRWDWGDAVEDPAPR
jgi:ribosomal protein RSM22 (predicted rRNA methylase)